MNSSTEQLSSSLGTKLSTGTSSIDRSSPLSRARITTWGGTVQTDSGPVVSVQPRERATPVPVASEKQASRRRDRYKLKALRWCKSSLSETREWGATPYTHPPLQGLEDDSVVKRGVENVGGWRKGGVGRAQGWRKGDLVVGVKGNCKERGATLRKEISVKCRRQARLRTRLKVKNTRSIFKVCCTSYQGVLYIV
eukprot:1951164-Pyramimonas_sp.AAC.1